MNNNDETFDRRQLDKQLEHPADGFAPNEQRMVQDLHHAYSSYEQENAQSLQHVWMRLDHQRQRQQQRREAEAVPITRLQRKQKMKDISFSSHQSQRSLKSTLSMIAAVLIVALLAGSALVLFNSLRQSSHGRNGGNPTAPQLPDTPVVNASGIYIEYMSKQHNYVLSKLDTRTHKPLWTFQRSDLMELGDPTVYGDTVFLNASNDMTNQSHLVALDAMTGKQRWDVPFQVVMSDSVPGGSSPTNMGVLTAAVASNSMVFVTNRAGTVFAFDAKTGKQKWTYETGASALVRTYYTDPSTGKQMLAGETVYDGSTPVVSHGVLYGTLEKTLYAINIQTGKKVWTSKISVQNQVFGDAQIVDGVIYASSYAISAHHAGQAYQSYVYAFAAQDGKQNWNYSVQSNASSGLAIDSGHIYFLASSPAGDNAPLSSTLYALNLQGEKVWTHDYSNPTVYGLVAGNGYISVSGGTYDQGNVVSYTLFVLKANGQAAWQKDVVTDPISIENGVLYTKGGRTIIAYDLGHQRELWHGEYGENVVDKTGASFSLGWVVVVP